MRTHSTGRRQSLVCTGLALSVLSLGACGGGGGDAGPGPTGPPPPAAVATVTVSPDSSDVIAGGTVQVTAVLRDAAGNILSGRQVAWSLSDAALATVSSAGVVTTILAGRVVVTAAAEGKSGTAVVRSRTQHDSLPGSPGGPAVAGIPKVRHVPVATDFLPHGALGGLMVSFNTAVVTIKSGATVAELNQFLRAFEARIVGGVPGAAGAANGIVVLRLPTRTHAAMDTAITAMAQHGIVAGAFPDHLLRPLVVTSTGVPPDTPLAWSWSPAPSDGNWGLEKMRVPQMWNLNSMTSQGTRLVTVGVFDDGFRDHRDLIFHGNPTAEQMHGNAPDHGNHVSGIIGATYNNGFGVDGISPFTRLVVRSLRATSDWITGFGTFIEDYPEVRVVNVSLGFNWSQFGISTTTNALARWYANSGGEAVRTTLQSLVASGRELPVIVVAAGNESNDGYGDQLAAYASPWANAALLQQVAPIIVVESLRLDPVQFTTSRSPFSNLGGHVSAPGSTVMSTVLNDGYAVMSGTSMASPHVAGLAAYLYSLAPGLPAPTMATNVVRGLLLESATAVAGAAPMADAFAAALHLDALHGNDDLLRGLLDIDDGSIDGNARVSASGAVVTAEDQDGNGREGDGRIDMADFRRWRDALLQAEGPPGLDLDGAPDHPKKDLNRSGDVLLSDPILEGGIFPRADFNGDGQVHRTATVKIPGRLRNGPPMTDLEVLRRFFDDPHYTEDVLPVLVNSGDITVDLAKCFALPHVNSVRTRVELASDPGVTVHERTNVVADGPQVITLPVNAGGYKLTSAALDAGGTVLGKSRPASPSVTLGGDRHLEPDCDAVALSVIFPQSVPTGTPTQLDIKAGERDPATGVVTYKAGIQISISVNGGTVAAATGTTNAEGRFITTATMAASSSEMTINVTATIADGGSRRVSVSAVSRGYTLSFFTAADAGSCHDQEEVRLEKSANIAAAANCAANGATWASNGSVNSAIGKGTLAASVTGSGTATDFTSGEANSWFNLRDTVIIDAPGLTGTVGSFVPRLRVTGSMSASGSCAGLVYSRALWGATYFTSSPQFGIQRFFGNTLAVSGFVTQCAPFNSGIQLPVELQGNPISFTYGVPFGLILENTVEVLVKAEEAGNSLAGAAASITLTFQWLGMQGLPPGATVTSRTQVNWALPIP